MTIINKEHFYLCSEFGGLREVKNRKNSIFLEGKWIACMYRINDNLFIVGTNSHLLLFDKKRKALRKKIIEGANFK